MAAKIECSLSLTNSLFAWQDYVRQMIKVFNDAEDMESLDDLHSLCTMMSTICECFRKRHSSQRARAETTVPLVSLNDNGLYEYLLQEDVFLGMAGIMECACQAIGYESLISEFLYKQTTRTTRLTRPRIGISYRKVHASKKWYRSQMIPFEPKYIRHIAYST